MAAKESLHWSSLARQLAVGALLAGCGAFWLAKVNSIVPDPYLDEEFHVRQAQVFCKGDFQTWDPKITTPPGLYLVSWFIYRLTGRCSITDLRALNVVTVVLGYLYTYNILRTQGRTKNRSSSSSQQDTWLLTAANTWLFPPLFFFSGLYYTDLQSAFWVILSYQSYLRYERRGFTSWSDAFSQVKFGIIALSFRQTNIFWVAIFPAGLAVVASAKKSKNKTRTTSPSSQSLWTICTQSWKESILYDLPVYDAQIEDYFITTVSLAIVAVRNWKKMISILAPYLMLLACFAGFVIWNGGVVLGDKSNHVATIHLPQMLYLWPYMLFFSWPIITQSFLQGNITVCNTWSQVPRKVLLLGTMTNLAMGIVHYNTIIHPFTLADNRHYVFYVFRILLRDSAIKYLAAPVYILSGYAVIQALGAQPQASQKQLKRTDSTAAPSGCRSSFVLVWLITTTLSLVTAPLVEPRYAIIAWIMWRMHVPVEAARVRPERQDTAGESERWFGTQWRSIYGVIVETLWFLTIAVGTSYMFLYRGFGWPQEPGRIQRFMW